MTKRPPFDRMQVNVLADVIAKLRAELLSTMKAHTATLREEMGLPVAMPPPPKRRFKVPAPRGRQW